MPPVLAKDGWRARDSGKWGQTKLEFLDRYCPAAIQVTRRKLQRYYLDLFAGPGMNVVRGDAATEFEGSPLRVLRYAGSQRKDLSFTDAVFINAMPRDHQALEARVDAMIVRQESRIARERIRLVSGDANEEVTRVLRDIPKKAYIMVFADMEAPKQWPWESMKALKAQGHESIDLYTLFPLDMALVRLLSYKKDQTERYSEALTRFFGTEDWRAVAARRVTDAHSIDLRRGLVDLYLKQLRTLWKNAGEMTDVYLRGEQRLYKMLFASNDPTAKVISDWIKSHSKDQSQTTLFD